MARRPVVPRMGPTFDLLVHAGREAITRFESLRRRSDIGTIMLYEDAYNMVISDALGYLRHRSKLFTNEEAEREFNMRVQSRAKNMGIDVQDFGLRFIKQWMRDSRPDRFDERYEPVTTEHVYKVLLAGADGYDRVFVDRGIFVKDSQFVRNRDGILESHDPTTNTWSKVEDGTFYALRDDVYEAERKAFEAATREEEAWQEKEKKQKREYEQRRREQPNGNDRWYGFSNLGTPPEEIAKKELEKYNITDLRTYKKWALRNHPDKFRTAEEIHAKTELMKIVNNLIVEAKFKTNDARQEV